MSTAQHRRLAKKKRLLRIAQPSNELKKKRMWWSRPTRGGEAQMLEQAHERRWSEATEYPNRLEWSGWSGVELVE